MIIARCLVKKERCYNDFGLWLLV